LIIDLRDGRKIGGRAALDGRLCEMAQRIGDQRKAPRVR
jgi:hypothetical protein